MGEREREREYSVCATDMHSNLVLALISLVQAEI